LGLLDITTTLKPHKITRQREVRCVDGSVVQGYEIHHGETLSSTQAFPHLEDGLGWQQSNVWGVYWRTPATVNASSNGWVGGRRLRIGRSLWMRRSSAPPR
jgi:cobyric acid synthase